MLVCYLSVLIVFRPKLSLWLWWRFLTIVCHPSSPTAREGLARILLQFCPRSSFFPLAHLNSLGAMTSFCNALMDCELMRAATRSRAHDNRLKIGIGVSTYFVLTCRPWLSVLIVDIAGTGKKGLSLLHLHAYTMD